MNTLNIYRNAVLISTVPIDEQTVLTKKIMNEDKVTASFIIPTVIPVKLGDYVIVNGQNYYLNQPPSIDKQNDESYKYNMIFQSVLYDMYGKLLISTDGLIDFSYTGNAEDILHFIVENMNAIYTGWAVGDVDASEKKTLQFENESCRTALTKLASEFNFEFELIGKTINLKEAIGTATAHSFKYGEGKGLYNIARTTVESNTLFTRVYGFGSTKNIPYTYRNHAKRLVFEGRFLEKNTSVYGVREGQYTNEDIFPNRTATVTAANMLAIATGFDATNSYVEDSSLDFDINDYLTEGLTAKIVFKSGDCSGYEFEIWKYDHATKRIYINAFNESDGYQLPNASNKPQVGDTYTLVNIDMPYLYVIAAENALKAATQKFLDENCVPKSLYLVKLDPKYAKANSITIDAGDLVKITDTFLGIDRLIRVAQISYPLVNPHKMNAMIADFVPYSLQAQVAKASVSTSKAITNIKNTINNVVQNTINNTTANSTTNTTNVFNSNKRKITINGIEYVWEKAFDNTGEELEIADVIYGNYWNRFVFVDKWLYLGGIKELRDNWDEVETTDNTPEV